MMSAPVGSEVGCGVRVVFGVGDGIGVKVGVGCMMTSRTHSRAFSGPWLGVGGGPPPAQTVNDARTA